MLNKDLLNCQNARIAAGNSAMMEPNRTGMEICTMCFRATSAARCIIGTPLTANADAADMRCGMCMTQKITPFLSAGTNQLAIWQ